MQVHETSGSCRCKIWELVCQFGGRVIQCITYNLKYLVQLGIAIERRYNVVWQDVDVESARC